MYNVVSTLAPSFLIGSYSFLQVTRTAIKAWIWSEFSKIEHRYMELAALECLKKSPYTYNLSNVVSTLMLSFLDGSLSFLQISRATIKAFHAFDFWPHLISNYS